LDLKRYNQRYDLLVRDLKNPDSDTTIKIAGLVAREGHDFFAKAMTPQRWAALSDDQRAAALTKYYAVGKERMEDDFAKRGGDPRTYTPDFNGDGSDMYFYLPEGDAPSNPERLKNAIDPGRRTQVSPGAETADASGAGANGVGSSGSRPSETGPATGGTGAAAAGRRQRQLSDRERLRDHAAHDVRGACDRAAACGRSVPPHRLDRLARRSLARRGDRRADARLGAGVARIRVRAGVRRAIAGHAAA
ncbi:MAG TPA: hypothetical protein VGZ47_14915, partial [Gemmataceae bacterium]|nr:hypothetical protein [Gemmataceae bacterium]